MSCVFSYFPVREQTFEDAFWKLLQGCLGWSMAGRSLVPIVTSVAVTQMEQAFWWKTKTAWQAENSSSVPRGEP